MHAFIGLWITGLSMLAAAVGQGEEVKSSKVQSATEGGVLVVRHSASSAGPAADQISEVQRVILAPATPAPAAVQVTARPYPLARVRIADNYKYTEARGHIRSQRRMIWENRPRRDWTYHPVPERSQEEVERLTRYRPTMY